MTLLNLRALHITYFRFFEGVSGPRVALYGHPSFSGDGWIANVNASDIFVETPKMLSDFRLYAMHELPSNTRYKSTFLDCLQDPIEFLNAHEESARRSTGTELSGHHRSIAFYPHIPKAGGETIKHGFYDAFGRDRCLKVWMPRFGADFGPRQFIKLPPERLKDIDAVVGHLSVAQFAQNGYMKSLMDCGGVHIFSSIREPIERIISLFNFISLYRDHPRHHKVTSMTLDDFALQEIPNAQYHYLALEAGQPIRAILDLSCIYPMNKSREGLRLFLERHFCKATDDLKILNRSQDLSTLRDRKLKTIEDLDSKTIERLREMHHLDFELFNAVVTKYTTPSEGQD